MVLNYILLKGKGSSKYTLSTWKSETGSTATVKQHIQLKNCAAGKRKGSVFRGLECVYLICGHWANSGLATWRRSPVKRNVLSSCLNSYRRVSASMFALRRYSPSCCICHSGTCELCASQGSYRLSVLPCHRLGLWSSWKLAGCCDSLNTHLM